MTKKAFLIFPLLISSAAFPAPPQSEISVKLVPERREYVVGERIRAVVDIANSSADSIDVGKPGSADIFRIEVLHPKGFDQPGIVYIR